MFVLIFAFIHLSYLFLLFRNNPQFLSSFDMAYLDFLLDSKRIAHWFCVSIDLISRLADNPIYFH